MKKHDTRPSWDEYYMKLAHVVRSRGNCTRRMVGSVTVRENRIITTGYNGTPHNIKNCFDGGCERCSRRDRGEIESYEYEESCVCIHAEQNALIQAAYLGVSVRGAVLYTTASPCSTCAKLIINAGISEVVYEEDFPDPIGRKILSEAGVKIRKLT